MATLNINPIKTRKLVPPQDDMFAVFDESVPRLQNGDVVAVTSKIVSIHQGRCIPVDEIPDKDELIYKEAEYYIPRSECPGEYVVMTMKNNILIPTAGIDASNAARHYILWPENLEQSAEEIYEYFKQRDRVEEFGIVITDSHTTPLRRGVSGIALSWHGLEPLRDYRGSEDIFGEKLKITQTNIVDGIASLAVITMGEGNEQTPVVVMQGLEGVTFTDEPTHEAHRMPPEQDIYYPFFKNLYEANE